MGFFKFDLFYNNIEVGFDYVKLGLDKSKKMLLFVFIFNLSLLECFFNDWFCYFEDFNIFIKFYIFIYICEVYKN